MLLSVYADPSISLPGPPLTYDSAVTALLESGVNVGIGVIDTSAARNTRFDVAWVSVQAKARLPRTDSLF
jgi:hypothetical protein